MRARTSYSMMWSTSGGTAYIHPRRCAIDLNFFQRRGRKTATHLRHTSPQAGRRFLGRIAAGKEFVGRQLELVQGRSAFRAARIGVIGSIGRVASRNFRKGIKAGKGNRSACRHCRRWTSAWYRGVRGGSRRTNGGSAEVPARRKGRSESSALTTLVSFAWRM